MSTVFFILMIISMLAVVATLVAGLAVMTKGGALDKKYANRLMQARIMFQGLAIGFFVLALLAAKN